MFNVIVDAIRFKSIILLFVPLSPLFSFFCPLGGDYLPIYLIYASIFIEQSF